MLRSFCIKNYALVDELTVEFPSGLVIITGETGSGKSIIIDALGLILGTRASADVVRKGSDKAVIEATFLVTGNKRLRQLLEDSGIEPSDELIVRREISARGQSRCFVADSPVTLALQKQIGEHLVDLHGQHEHQSLLRVDTHIAMLDDFGGLDGMVEEFRAARKKLREIATELQELRRREQQLSEKREFYEFQMREIDALAPRVGEEEELESELRILENSEKLFGTTGQLYGLLYEGEQSVHDLLVVIRNQLQDLAEIDKQFAESALECSSAEAIVSELAKFIQAYNARVEFNPERLEALRERLGKLALLKRKYGGSLEQTIAHREKIGQEVLLAETFNDVTAGLEKGYAEARSECAGIAQRLSAKRHDVAKKVDKAVLAELEKLGIRNGRFSTRIGQIEEAAEDAGASADVLEIGRNAYRINSRGYDTVEFFISTNLGEEEMPLARVASGGEISRVMLALKSILAKSDRLPVLIFDEIDVGVSGRVAQTVGRSLKSLSNFHQVITITHLPQIAGLADAHFVVEKDERGGRTTSRMRRLALEEQVHEVAKLMSGATVTDAGLSGARELMGLSRQG
ncbi:MAG TPA: DNA repair protein RecN [Bacteroidota bacterium]|nr:DNA repair protein RecN [Bacteroidota bacterium]